MALYGYNGLCNVQTWKEREWTSDTLREIQYTHPLWRMVVEELEREGLYFHKDNTQITCCS